MRRAAQQQQQLLLLVARRGAAAAGAASSAAAQRSGGGARGAAFAGSAATGAAALRAAAAAAAAAAAPSWSSSLSLAALAAARRGQQQPALRLRAFSSTSLAATPAATARAVLATAEAAASSTALGAALLNALAVVSPHLPVALGLLLVDFAAGFSLLRLRVVLAHADAAAADALLPQPPLIGARVLFAEDDDELLLSSNSNGASSSSSSAAALKRLAESYLAAARLAARDLASALSGAVRIAALCVLFFPLAATAPLALSEYFGYPGRQRWMALLVGTLETAGPAFIKWGQWAATRHDLFPPDACAALERLHASAPAHPFRHTRRAILSSLGVEPEVLFDYLDPRPLASGSIGQIHRAALSAKGAKAAGVSRGTIVAVKVRHPGVGEAIARDFAAMAVMARWATAWLPGAKNLRLEETLKQFAAPLREQVDLSREAHNLFRFNANFRRARGVSFPSPLYPLVAEDVLVESYEAGTHIGAFLPPHGKFGGGGGGGKGGKGGGSSKDDDEEEAALDEEERRRRREQQQWPPRRDQGRRQGPPGPLRRAANALHPGPGPVAATAPYEGAIDVWHPPPRPGPPASAVRRRLQRVAGRRSRDDDGDGEGDDGDGDGASGGERLSPSERAEAARRQRQQQRRERRQREVLAAAQAVAASAAAIAAAQPPPPPRVLRGRHYPLSGENDDDAEDDDDDDDDMDAADDYAMALGVPKSRRPRSSSSSARTGRGSGSNSNNAPPSPVPPPPAPQLPTGALHGSPYGGRLAELGSGAMLQMMLLDNLVHSDLHPGNILVRLEAPKGWLLGGAYKAAGAAVDALGRLERRAMAATAEAAAEAAAAAGTGIAAESGGGGADAADASSFAGEDLTAAAAAATAERRREAATAAAAAAAAARLKEDGGESAGERRPSYAWQALSSLGTWWSGGASASEQQQQQQQAPPPPPPPPAPLLARAAHTLAHRLAAARASWLQPRIVLLDVGMATELSDEDQACMLGLFRAFAAMDGRAAARWILRFPGEEGAGGGDGGGGGGEGGAQQPQKQKQQCPDPRAFEEDMEATFAQIRRGLADAESEAERRDAQRARAAAASSDFWSGFGAGRYVPPSASGGGAGGDSDGDQQADTTTATTTTTATPTDTFDSGAAALAAVLEHIRRHGVSLPGHICAVVVTTLVLEGWSNQLDPRHSVLEQVRAMFASAGSPWRERVGRSVDAIMGAAGGGSAVDGDEAAAVAF